MFGTFSYQTKIFLALAAFLFVMLTVVNVIHYYRNESMIMHDLAQNKQQTTIKLQEQVDEMLTEMDKLTISVNASDAIMDVMKSISSDSDENYFIEHAKVSADVKNTLFSFMSLQPLKGRISLVSRYGDYLDVSNKMDTIKISKSEIRQQSTFQEYLDMEAYKRYLPPHPDPWSVSGDSVISIVRPLRDNYNVYGYVEISYTLKELEDIFFFRNDLTVGNVLILGADRTILYSSLTPEQEQLFDDAARMAMPLDSEFGHFPWKQSGAHHMVFYSKLASTDWNVLLIEDLTVFRRPIESLRLSSITLFLAVLTVLLLLLYLYTNRVTRPLRRLKDSLAKVDLKTLELLPSKLRTRNEITLLGVAFQGLLDELKISMRQAEKSSERAMVAQMNALQAQVAPHFLHNTLTVIAAYSQRSDNQKVTEMCIALSDMLRYTMKFDRKVSTLGAELDHVEQYLTLMRYKYEGLLDIDMNIDPAIRSIPLPRLSLQPIVENAFQHGFSGVDPPWKLAVTGSVHAGRWQMTIADNGIGFNLELLRKMHQKLNELKDDPGAETEHLAEEEMVDDQVPIRRSNGIGLTNVFARLMLFYGEHVAIHMDNATDGGAVITITGGLQNAQNHVDRRRTADPSHGKGDD